MRNPLSVTTFILLVIVAGVFYIAHGFHEARLDRVAELRADHLAKITRECHRMYPHSEYRQEGCVQGIMGDSR